MKLSFPQKRETQSSVDFLPQPSRGPSLPLAQPGLLCRGSHSAPPSKLPQGLNVPSLLALRGNSEHNLPGKKGDRPCLRLRVGFTEGGIDVPLAKSKAEQV